MRAMVDLNAQSLSVADLPERFRRFAAVEAVDSPLYAALAEACAADETALRLAALRRPEQPPATILFAAIHGLILAGDPHPLRAFYASVETAPRQPELAAPVLADFLRTRYGVLAPVVAQGRVATNEPARMAPLMLGLAAGIALAGGAEAIALIDAGASAGLTLYPDLVAFDFGDLREAGPHDAPLRIVARLDPLEAPGPADLPPAVSRVGIDLAPLNAADPADAAWLRALIWPEHADRFARLETALALARIAPPTLIAGDAAVLIADALRAAPEDALVCVTHSLTLHQWTDAARRLFHEQLKAGSLRRPIVRASLEWKSGDAAPTVEASLYRGGAQDARVAVGHADPHGRWIALHDAAV
jgi:hypothetical protein